VRGENLLRSDNINLGPPTVLTAQNAASLGVANPNPQQIGRPYYGTTNRLDPLFNNIQQVSSASRSRYWGLQFMLQKRMSHGLELRANYTLSEAKDDSSDFTQAEQPNDPYNRDAEFVLGRAPAAPVHADQRVGAAVQERAGRPAGRARAARRLGASPPRGRCAAARRATRRSAPT
jgi:hypothetical protein